MTLFKPCLLPAAIALYAQCAAGNDAHWQNPADRYADAWTRYQQAECPLPDDGIRHFVYFARDRDSLRGHPLLQHPRFAGAQVMYLWRDLEPERDQYDFSRIHADIDYLASHGKSLWIQLQDATFFDPYQPAPDYLLSDEFAGGAVPQYTDEGDTEGWVVKRWNPAVQARFAALLEALAGAFDGTIAGINLQESAIGVSQVSSGDFTPEAYAQALKTNMSALGSAFDVSMTMQYANFMPGEWLPWEDEGYLESIYEHGQAIGVGLGAPDLMVTRRGQLNHALAMMHEDEYSVPLGIAVQDGNYAGVTGREVAANEPAGSLVPLLHAFAADFLNVDIMFWVNQPPYFERDVLPCFGSKPQP
ncbi:hypothetical protein F3N42_13630 [Marinihelvus fidelis]|uniref:Glycoside hydrolase family 42 N-terminal domain-containing protein n=1 Tax=Marinihelvus fidelis TaxID=2613842 RepID=A0A5N0T5I7_9GAMM|nr:hypothetical protein [Marinihelvus fidelis]KAA9130203.1 hypothetical protein F3N42_13630 [Marinihelvus fidelis]